MSKFSNLLNENKNIIKLNEDDVFIAMDDIYWVSRDEDFDDCRVFRLSVYEDESGVYVDVYSGHKIVRSIATELIEETDKKLLAVIDKAIEANRVISRDYR